MLKRSIDSLDIILKETGNVNVPVTRTQALNERNYGDLQGLNKTETAAKYGEQQVAIWRRSYDVQPPGGESLKDTAARVIPYYQKEIEPSLKAGENIIISAHGNSLRSLMMYLEHIPEDKIVKVEIPTGMPRLYKLDEQLNILEVKYL